MPSKMVTDRQKLTGALRQAALSHATEVSARLTGLLTPLLEDGETLPDLALLQRLPARLLEQRERSLVQADEAHLAELVDDRDPRRRRDELAEELRITLVRIRGTVSALFGSDFATDVLGIEGSTAADPVVLHRQAVRALERLSSAEPPLPPVQVAGIQLDAPAMVAVLQPATDNLASALDDVARERREAETTLTAKTEALAAYDAAASQVVHFLTGLYDLADRPQFAARVRLTQTRGGGRDTSEGDVPPAQGDTEPPADGAPAETTPPDTTSPDTAELTGAP